MNIALTGNVFPFGEGHAYGGERILGYLTEELIKLGHKVWLFAREGTVPPKGVEDFMPVGPLQDNIDVHYEAVLDYSIKKGISCWDIYQCNYFGNGYNTNIHFFARSVVELTWCVWCHCSPFFGSNKAKNIISYSRRMQEDFTAREVPTTMIHYGIPRNLYKFEPDSEDYVVWIGKIEGGKYPKAAIELAKAAGLKIVVIGPPYNTGCFWSQVAPYIDNETVFWMRGASDQQKQKLMSKAKAFISSNDNSWREHFGIVNIEALAMGVPIIAFNRKGADCAIKTDALIKEGEQGFFLDYEDSNDLGFIIDKGRELLGQIHHIDRRKCRERFEDMWTSELMARRYEWFYEYVLNFGPVDTVEIPF